MINPLRRQLLHVLGDDANDTRECYLRSLAETAMSRYKQLVRPKRKLSSYNGHVGQVLAE